MLSFHSLFRTKNIAMVLPDRALVAVGLWLILRIKSRRRKRRFYIRDINLSRLMEGEFATLVKPMKNRFIDDHFKYFRMTNLRFDDLLRRIGPRLDHNGNHRMPVSPTERLAITLR
jgi:hypothetical protein